MKLRNTISASILAVIIAAIVSVNYASAENGSQYSKEPADGESGIYANFNSSDAAIKSNARLNFS